jgi:hypothetical protein
MAVLIIRSSFLPNWAKIPTLILDKEESREFPAVSMVSPTAFA